MNKKLLILTITMVGTLVSRTGFAQENTAHFAPITPKWVSDKGSWVIESNLKAPLNSTVYFYNNQNMLVYKEQIEGRKLNLKKRKVLMQLKYALEKSVDEWSAYHVINENKMLVAAAIHHK